MGLPGDVRARRGTRRIPREIKRSCSCRAADVDFDPPVADGNPPLPAQKTNHLENCRRELGYFRVIIATGQTVRTLKDVWNLGAEIAARSDGRNDRCTGPHQFLRHVRIDMGNPAKIDGGERGSLIAVADCRRIVDQNVLARVRSKSSIMLRIVSVNLTWLSCDADPRIAISYRLIEASSASSLRCRLDPSGQVSVAVVDHPIVGGIDAAQAHLPTALVPLPII